MSYKFLPHTADIKVRVIAPNLARAFKESAIVLNKTIKGNTRVNPVTRKEIFIRGRDEENLLYNFLEEFLFLLDAKNSLVSQIKNLKINERLELKAELLGDKASNYKFNNNVKAITYNEMQIKKIKNKFAIEFVLDV